MVISHLRGNHRTQRPYIECIKSRVVCQPAMYRATVAGYSAQWGGGRLPVLNRVRLTRGVNITGTDIAPLVEQETAAGVRTPNNRNAI